MRFPQSEQLILPCRFEQFVPGKLHTDGRRYLPLVLLRPLQGASLDNLVARPVDVLGVVDRHHVVDPTLARREGVARLVFLLSHVRIQDPPYRQGLVAEDASAADGPSTVPTAYGQVLTVLTWETGNSPLSYESLFMELLLDIGIGVVGVRTSLTADRVSELLGKRRLTAGDWIGVWRSRVDILAFEPRNHESLPT